MASSADRFRQNTKDTLAKRAAYVCSNPACRAMTTGPHTDSDRSSMVGEAAHIFGANPGSARYRSSMSSTERSSITNAIWLCRKCARLIDVDGDRFPARLLLQWKREHEATLREGMVSADYLWPHAPRSAESTPFEGFPAEIIQTVLDKPDYWASILTAQLLRHLCAVPRQQIDELRRGLYFSRGPRVDRRNIVDWFQSLTQDLERLVGFAKVLIDQELNRALRSSDSVVILSVCKHCRDFADHLVDWEREAQSARGDKNLRLVQADLLGTTKALSNWIYAVPDRLDQLIAEYSRDGKMRNETIVLEAPTGVVVAAKRVRKIASGRSGRLWFG